MIFYTFYFFFFYRHISIRKILQNYIEINLLADSLIWLIDIYGLVLSYIIIYNKFSWRFF